jgi:hypothetical protein
MWKESTELNLQASNRPDAGKQKPGTGQEIGINSGNYTVKKCALFSRPQNGYQLPNSHWSGIIKLFSSGEISVSDIPAEEGKISNLFLQCNWPCACKESTELNLQESNRPSKRTVVLKV